ncbi:hypothetical protein [Acidovorax sp. SUPP2825]|uniref:DUF6980 family protein n=1 Tax=Acidovorax sp. SUPP2825 TaxID=2920879 RepID=UPI0023DE467A|nr:hypothetical protein [Acidovorax sp. SUPP2825]GKS96693.1 hypothetical protein AVAK2825_19180 [Acidovorax sp. SUPP2825]
MYDLVISDDFNLEFIPKFREYGITYGNGGSYQAIDYCPWCGEKLPPSLRAAWFDVLDRIGLEPEDNIPLEMQSEAWWLNDEHKDLNR